MKCPAYTKPQNAAYRVLRKLEEASETRHECVKIQFRMGLWDVGQRYEKLPPQEEFTASTISQISRDYHRVKYMISLLNALTSSALELEKLYEDALKPITFKLSKGLSSLPDEIIAHIFKLATDHKHKGTRHAIWLSQVSRRFRSIALGDKSLWTTLNLWYDTTEEELGKIVSRSGTEADLHIVVNMNPSISVRQAGEFLTRCSHTTHRWRTLTMNGHWIQDGNIAMDVPLGQMVSLSDLTLPRLEELCISEHHHNEEIDEPFWKSASSDVWYREPLSRPWITPRLHIFRSTNFIPFASFPFSCITTFDLSLTLIRKSVQDQIRKLVAFLNAMSSIVDFKLLLKNDTMFPLDGPYLPEIDTLTHPEAICLSVKSFKLHVSKFEVQEGGNQWLEPIVQALCFPNMNSLSLTIELDDGDVGTTNDLLPSFVDVLLPAPDTHPHLTTLDISLPFPESAGKYLGRTGRDMVLPIPLDLVPNVTSMRVETCGGVIFYGEEVSPDSEDHWAANSSLRELQLRSCANLDAELFLATVQSLKDVNESGKLDELVIQNCPLLDHDVCCMIAEKENLRFNE